VTAAKMNKAEIAR